MRRWIIIAGIIGLVWGLGPTASFSAPALDSIQPQGRVNDFAGILIPAQRADLEMILATCAAQDQADVVVVTVPSLEGGEINDSAERLFNRWGIGRKGQDRGLLFLLALEERKVRMEVGYGLEPILTDAVVGRLLDEFVIPRFKENDYAAGLKANANFMALQDELTGTENRIAVERKRYNEAIRNYNLAVRTYPGRFLAGTFGFLPKDDYLKADTGSHEVPKVQF